MPSDSTVRNNLEAGPDAVGTEWKVVTREGTKPDEILPAEKGRALGRVLHVLGCPIGDKNADSTKSLPGFIHEAPVNVRAAWVTNFLRERGTHHPNKATQTIQIVHGGLYLRSLAALIEDVTNANATIRTNQIIVSADAVRALGLA